MSALAQQHGAINLAQGFPSYACDPELIELAYGYMKAGHNQYAPMAGTMSLREAISDKISKLYNTRYNVSDEICVTAGATEAVYVALQSLLEANDEVIIFEPAFDIYAAAVQKAGAKPVYVKLEFPDFSINWDKVRAAITPKTKLIILNSPHNPTATIVGQADIVALADLTQRHNLFVLSDEVYEHMVYDGEKHYSVIQNEILRDRSLVVFSLGKTYHVTGWRLGYCVGPKYLIDKFKHIHQYVTFSAATPLQLACADQLRKENSYLNLPAFFQQKRDLFLQHMQHSGFVPLPSKGTYFQLMSYRGLHEGADVDVAKRLTETHKVATIPISVFYHDKTQQQILRFCFAKTSEDLEQAAKRLREL